MEEETVEIKFPPWAQEISVTLKGVTTWVKPEFYLNDELISATGLSVTFMFKPDSRLLVIARPQGKKPWNLECTFYTQKQPVNTNKRKLGGGQTYRQTFLLVKK